ncbi:MAG: flavodoxin [Oscillospiraceae bacterium]|nr:flavodoxin [Oscillospiraceae bacterium]
MNIAIRYYTRSGNTKKLADAISEALNIEAFDVSVPFSEKTDILFLGCSYYAFDVDPIVKDFIVNNKDNIGKIICFGTSAMMKSMKKPVTKVAKTVGVTVSDEEFHCRGRFGKIHKNRPDADDLKDAAEFAKKVVQ